MKHITKNHFDLSKISADLVCNKPPNMPDNTKPQTAAQALWEEIQKRGTPPEEIKAAFDKVCDYLFIPWVYDD